MKEIFAKRLKELREEKGLSMLALSKMIGISDSSIGRWEHAEGDIRGEQLVVLAKFFHVSTDYLLGLED